MLSSARLRLPGNRPLARLLAAGGVSGIGDWAYLTALPVLVFQRTGDVWLVGLVEAARLLPFLLLSAPAGAVADRLPKRQLLIATQSIRLGAMLVLAALTIAEAPVALIVALAMLAAAAGTFTFPAEAGLIPQLVRDDDELARANATASSLNGLACVVGPAVTGALLLVGGIAFAFIVNAASFGVVIAALLGVRPATAVTAHATECGQHPAPRVGWVQILRRVAPLLAIDGAISLCTGATGVLTLLVAVQLLGTDEAFVGALSAAGGVGGIVGGLMAATFARRIRRGQTAGIVAAAAGLATLAMTSAPIGALGGMAMAVGALVLLDALNTTALQQATWDGVTGRAVGLMYSLSAVWMAAGALGTPLLVGLVGTSGAILAMAAMVIALGLIGVTGTRGRAAARKPPLLADAQVNAAASAS